MKYANQLLMIVGVGVDGSRARVCAVYKHLQCLFRGFNMRYRGPKLRVRHLAFSLCALKSFENFLVPSQGQVKKSSTKPPRCKCIIFAGNLFKKKKKNSRHSMKKILELTSARRSKSPRSSTMVVFLDPALPLNDVHGQTRTILPCAESSRSPALSPISHLGALSAGLGLVG